MGYRMRFILTATFLLLTATAFCGERETIRDATGKVVGTATTSGNKTIYRDATGKTTGTATKDGCNAPHLSRVALRKSGKKVCFRGLRESVMPG